LHVRSWGNVADGTTFTRRCRPGQVLFGKRRAYQRKVAVAEFDAVVSGDIYVLAAKPERLLPELLPFFCLSERFFDHAVGTSAGSLSPRTNWSNLARFEFDLPPLDQQRRIAELAWKIELQCEALLVVESRVQGLHDAMVREQIWSACPERVSLQVLAKFSIPIQAIDIHRVSNMGFRSYLLRTLSVKMDIAPSKQVRYLGFPRARELRSDSTPVH
jgi:type I restriction enzyme, S subunit